jgi:hypothetical protein
MLDYRIYWLDANGHIVRADNLVAADDAEARGKAEALLGWHQRSRFSAPIGWWRRWSPKADRRTRYSRPTSRSSIVRLSLDQHAPVQAGNLLHHCEVQTLGAG